MCKLFRAFGCCAIVNVTVGVSVTAAGDDYVLLQWWLHSAMLFSSNFDHSLLYFVCREKLKRASLCIIRGTV